MGLIEILLPDALINQPLVNSKFLVEGTECRPPLSCRAGTKNFAHEYSSRILTSSPPPPSSYLETGSALAAIINITGKIISSLYHAFLQMLEKNRTGGAE